MAHNVLNTKQGASFFVDLDNLIKEEIKEEANKLASQKQNPKSTSLYIPLYEKQGVPQSSNVEKALNSTFTKEDFEKFRNVQNDITGQFRSGRASTLSIEQQEDDKIISKRKTRVSISGELTRAKSSPDILVTNKQKKIKGIELMSNISEKNKRKMVEKRITSVIQFPNLPFQMAKNQNIQSPISAVNVLDRSEKPDKRNIQIEEMFSQYQPELSYAITSILPPIHSNSKIINNSNSKTTNSAGNSPVKSKSNTQTRKQGLNKKNKNTKNVSQKQTAAKKPKKNKIDASSEKLPSKKVRKTSKLKEQKLNNKIKDNLEALKMDVDNILKYKSDGFSERGDLLIGETNDSDVSCKCTFLESNSLTLNEIDQFQTDSNIVSENENKVRHKHYNVSFESYPEQTTDTLDNFYDAVLSAKPLEDFKVRNNFFVPLEPAVNQDIINYPKKATKSLPESFDLVNSFEKFLSFDEIPTSESNYEINEFILSRISEESSTFLSPTIITNKSEKTSGTHDATKQASATTTTTSKDSTFNREMSKLIFQPQNRVKIKNVQNSLDSITLDHTFDNSESLNLSSGMAKESVDSVSSSSRSYLRSVLGMITPRNVYSSSSSCTTAESDVSILEWRKGKIIDKGAFGVVYQGLTSNAQLIAIKEVDIGHSNHAEKNFKKLQDEISILKGLKHPNIIKFIGTSLEHNCVHIFMEYIAGGSLAGLISSFGALNESIYQRYTRQIMSAVAYIHGCGVVHRDIKGANILITVKGSIKLIDFGCAKEMSLSVGSTVLLKSVKGTPYWMAPEVIRGTGCNHKSDIWSIGCTVMEMATGKPPWSEYQPYAAMYAVAASEDDIPTLEASQHSHKAVSFVEVCMRRDMNSRPSAAELLKHPFVSDDP